MSDKQAAEGAAGSADLDAAIGALLDDWDRVPNDLKWGSDMVRLRASIERLERAVLARRPLPHAERYVIGADGSMRVEWKSPTAPRSAMEAES